MFFLPHPLGFGKNICSNRNSLEKKTFMFYISQVGELIMTTNDVHARPDRLKTGRLELLMKMYPGYEEPENVMDALEELEMLNIAHNDVDKVRVDNI